MWVLSTNCSTVIGQSQVKVSPNCFQPTENYLQAGERKLVPALVEWLVLVSYWMKNRGHSKESPLHQLSQLNFKTAVSFVSFCLLCGQGLFIETLPGNKTV